MIKTKIIATVGPACSNAEIVRAMLNSGVDVFRLNFSHGTLEEHTALLNLLKSVISGQHRMIAVIGDICGPKIRTGPISPEGQIIKSGDAVLIVREGDRADGLHFGTNYANFVDDMQVGHRIFIDDGQIELNVTKKTQNQLLCTVKTGGSLYTGKGINVPDTHISIPSITSRDWQCIDWAIQNNLDFLAMSFVRTADDILQLRNYLQEADADIKIIAKIETSQSLNHLDSIIETSDAVLVARGDLGVEIDLAEVPLVQKKITHLGRHYGKPVIVATQMLQSMINAPAPTRAEVSDVANAIMDFADVVMLSGETAVGKFPVEAVKTICRIANVTEAFLDENKHIHPRAVTIDVLAITAAIARSVAQIVDDVRPKLVAVWSQTGSSAGLLSKARIDTPVLVFSSNERLCRQMSLHYGVMPFYQLTPENIDCFVGFVEKFVLEHNLAGAGDTVIIVVGEPVVAAGTKNAVLAHTITTH
jgi:pyruvate kinase